MNTSLIRQQDDETRAYNKEVIAKAQAQSKIEPEREADLACSALSDLYIQYAFFRAKGEYMDDVLWEQRNKPEPDWHPIMLYKFNEMYRRLTDKGKATACEDLPRFYEWVEKWY